MVCKISFSFISGISCSVVNRERIAVTCSLQSLKTEFEQHDAYMAELQKDVATFLEQGKLNAANRLENQVAILKVGVF